MGYCRVLARYPTAAILGCQLCQEQPLGQYCCPTRVQSFAWPIERREATRLGGPIGKEPGQRVLNGGSDIRY